MYVHKTLTDLDVIGTSSCLAETMLPSHITPIFASKIEPKTVYFPRKIEGNTLTKYSAEPFISLNTRYSEFIVFDKPFQARENYCLWIDQSRVYHYELANDVKKIFDKIYSDNILLAEKALAEGKLGIADMYWRIAFNVDSDNTYGWNIKIDIEHRRGDIESEALWIKIFEKLRRA